MYQHTREWLEVTLASVGDAVMATDIEARVLLLNPVAERLTGWTQSEALGRPIGDVFRIVNERTRLPAENPALRALAEGRIQGLANHTILIARDGTERGIDDSAAPIRDADGKIYGVVLVFRNVTAERRAERRRSARQAVAQILAQGAPTEEAEKRVVEALARELEWDAASLWMVDPEAQVLRRRAAWSTPKSGLESQLAREGSTPIARGAGLAGRAWSENRVVWLDGEATSSIEPIAHGALQAAACGALETLPASAGAVLGGIACPVPIDGQCQGALVLCNRGRQEADDDLAETMSTLAGLLGQFIQRRRAQAEVQRREEELEDFFRNAVVGLHWVAPDGAILRVNRAELDLLGYAEEEYVGRSIAEFYVDQDVIAGVLEQLRRGEEVRDQEARMRAKDGSIRHVLIDSNGLWEGERFVHSRCFTRDVTARKHAETTLSFLHQASQSLADLVDYRTTLQRVAGLAVPDFADWCVIHMLGPDRAVEQIAWVHRDPDRVQRVLDLFKQHPLDPDAPYGVPAVLRTGKPELLRAITDEMLRVAARSDEHLRQMRELQFSSSIIVPLVSKGQVIGAMRFIAAESGRRYGEADLETAQDLASRAAIAIENALLYERARESDRRKDEFIATLAHELRNPLAPIRSGLDVLSIDSSSLPSTVALMRRQLDHLVRLADDLLDVSRITHGKVELRRETIELGAVLDAAVAAVRAAAESRDHRILVTRPAQPIWLEADPVRVLQVIENLLSNAVKYTDPGGRIEVSIERDGDFAVVRVRDEGIGIDRDLLAEIFEPFTQASRGIDRAQGGLGIGLTLVRHFVEMHGGTVSASSSGSGRGSEFVTRLPIGEPSAAAKSEGDGQPRGTSTRRSVLVVDDNVGAASMLALLLSRLGADPVEIAADGHTAVGKAEELVPDVILLDIGLPGMDGYEVARELRRRPRLSKSVLVALTGYGQEEDRQRSREAGFDEHLVKPASVDDLQRVLTLTR